jgi:cytochrome c peroxidase
MGGAAMRGTWLLCCAFLGACLQESVVTDEERTALEQFELPTSPPPSPSNAFADNQAAAVLGKKFFFDPRFSGALGPANDGTTNGSLGAAGATERVSCYACHQVELGGADRRSRPAATSLGVNYGRRNAPTVINAAYSAAAGGGWQLWDGRRDSLWAVALGPLEGANEHAGTRLQFAHLIYDRYRAEYEPIFGPMPDLSDTVRFPPTGKPGQPPFEGMTDVDKTAINRVYANVGKAIEAYERLLVSSSFEPSPFDQFLAGDDDALSPAAIRGARLFIGKAACDECHRGPTLSDYGFHNIGCPQQGQNVPTIDDGRSVGISILQSDPFNRAGAFSDATDTSHLDGLAAEDLDLGAFRTPSLRNVEKTGPYMHDGVYENLRTVVDHYNLGGGFGPFSGTKEATIAPLLLSSDEIEDLVAFLRSLSDGPVKAHPAFPEGLLAPPGLPE